MEQVTVTISQSPTLESNTSERGRLVSFTDTFMTVT